MARYLVTGGCGFIGSHLVDALLQTGQEVIVLDDLSTGTQSNLSPKAQLIIGNICDRHTVLEAMSGTDGCFHLAAIASVTKATQEWLKTHQVNLTGTINIFEAAKQLNTKQPIPVVYASSAAVYGENLKIPLIEDLSPQPLNAYGADKVGCEYHAFVARNIHHIPTVGLRFFNVYGPRQFSGSDYSGVISLFMKKIQQQQPITIYGDGYQCRDFIYVTDVVRFLLKAMAKSEKNAEVYNVCTGKATYIKDLAVLCSQALQQPLLPINYSQARLGDIRISVGNPKKGEQLLGVKADVGIAEGLNAMVSNSREEDSKMRKQL